MENQLTVAQVADYLHCHSKTVCRYIKNGKLDAKRIGGKWLIPESEVKKIFE